MSPETRKRLSEMVSNELGMEPATMSDGEMVVGMLEWLVERAREQQDHTHSLKNNW